MDMIVKKEMTLGVSPEKLWPFLIESQYTKQYMFGCELVSEWKVGDSLLWMAEGKVVVKGDIIAIKENERLHYTTFDPNMGFEDADHNYILVTYEVQEEANGCRLEITQDFTGVDDAQKRFEESEQGWDHVLNSLKALVEGS